ncbi:MAG: anhydro-N-acetylmuramic acid kinase [Alphaproteobacteria bacterium]|nr:MAG: anhydro-N-acetylmuramic acid kinase [Alphaproteobacteria bacterium]
MVDVGPGRPVWALGLMSGTSMDGVDTALVLSDGETIAGFGPVFSLSPAYDAAGQARIAAAGRHCATRIAAGQAPDPAALADASRVVEARHGEAVAALRACGGGGRARVIGFHGQTVFHAPERGLTVQLGDGARLAAAVSAPVAWDFRSADMAAGGEGAPLAPFFHHACARWAGLGKPVAFLNIGGVANVTWIDPAIADPVAACLAFDTGPGNALIDDWMRRRTGRAPDRDGAAAAAGRVHRDRLAPTATRAWLDRPPPKSLDRNDFAALLAAMDGLSTEDGAATLTELTVDCIVDAGRHMPSRPSRWLVCGGGRRNATLMARLAEGLAAKVEPVESIGLDGDFLEAQAFAWLAVRALRGLPTSAPRTTGCAHPVCGGRISHPAG